MKRQIRIEGDVAYVALTGGYEAIIDAADVDMVSAWSWFAKAEKRGDGSIRTVYAARKETIGARKQRDVPMHRVICGTPSGYETDHKDGNGLNNRRANLRTATKSQNMHNRGKSCNNKSGFKGVYAHTEDKWRAQITLTGKKKHLGLFESAEEAAAAYAKASLEMHGDFGRAA